MFRAMHLSLLGCLLGTSGCHGLPPAPPAPSAAVGNYGEVIDYLQRHIRREMERQDVPGLALALVDDQQLVWARGFGYADRQHRINASEHTAFHAGDLSKLLIASATLQLAERGQLSLDAPLQDTLREFYVRSRFHADQSEADRAITFRRLLSHQSGLPGEHLPPLFGERPSSLGQLPAKVSGVWLSNPPGTQVAYSNLGYELVGAAIERNTGKHFEQHMREHLLDPLQMTRSSFARNALPQTQRAHGYSGGHTITMGVKERYDARDWTVWARSRFGPEVPIFLMGVSMGAATVLLAAGLNLPDNVCGIVADCGYTSPREITRKCLPEYLPGMPLELTYAVGRLGAILFGHFDPEDADCEAAAAQSKVPILFVHGDADGFVPYDMGKRNYEACRAKGKKFLTVHGAEHAVSYYHDNDAYTKQATEFLQDCLARRGFVWPPETDEPEK